MFELPEHPEPKLTRYYWLVNKLQALLANTNSKELRNFAVWASIVIILAIAGINNLDNNTGSSTDSSDKPKITDVSEYSNTADEYLEQLAERSKLWNTYGKIDDTNIGELPDELLLVTDESCELPSGEQISCPDSGEGPTDPENEISISTENLVDPTTSFQGYDQEVTGPNSIALSPDSNPNGGTQYELLFDQKEFQRINEGILNQELRQIHSDMGQEIHEWNQSKKDPKKLRQIVQRYISLLKNYVNENEHYAFFPDISINKYPGEGQSLFYVANTEGGYPCTIASEMVVDFFGSVGLSTMQQAGNRIENTDGTLLTNPIGHQVPSIILPNGEVIHLDLTPSVKPGKTPDIDIMEQLKDGKKTKIESIERRERIESILEEMLDFMENNKKELTIVSVLSALSAITVILLKKRKEKSKDSNKQEDEELTIQKEPANEKPLPTNDQLQNKSTEQEELSKNYLEHAQALVQENNFTMSQLMTIMQHIIYQTPPTIKGIDRLAHNKNYLDEEGNESLESAVLQIYWLLILNQDQGGLDLNTQYNPVLQSIINSFNTMMEKVDGEPFKVRMQ
jgi:hypothetical protein